MGFCYNLFGCFEGVLGLGVVFFHLGFVVVVVVFYLMVAFLPLYTIQWDSSC